MIYPPIKAYLVIGACLGLSAGAGVLVGTVLAKILGV